MALSQHDEQFDAAAQTAQRRRRRLLWMAALAVLLALGGGALAFSMYVGKQAEGFELTMEFGPRTTHVLGTNVTLSEGDTERKCVLSLLDFRALRQHAKPLTQATALTDKAARGAPTFMVSFTTEEGAAVNHGALAKEELEPIDRFIIQHASACIESPHAPTAPRPVK